MPTNEAMRIVMSEEVLRSFIRLILVQIWDPTGIKRFGIVVPAVVDDTDDDMLVVALEPLQHKEPIFGDFEAEYDAYIPAIQSMILTGNQWRKFTTICGWLKPNSWNGRGMKQ